MIITDTAPAICADANAAGNFSTWVAPVVTLADGSKVPSTSEAFRAECEARLMLSLEPIKQRERLAGIATKRGSTAALRLQAAMEAVEPAYVLDMPTRDARRAYLAELERTVGANARRRLEERILELHRSRQ